MPYSKIPSKQPAKFKNSLTFEETSIQTYNEDMIASLKKRLYFFVAGYFRFWARFVLERWQPRIVVVTGSNGKTTLLHLIESQLGEKAIFT